LRATSRTWTSAPAWIITDEATFVDWAQANPGPPDRQTSWRHLTADGKAADLTQPSAANQNRDFPPPVEPPPSVT